MKKIQLNIILAVALVLVAVCATYYFTVLSIKDNKAKGYEVAMPHPVCGPMIREKIIYKSHQLTSDTLKNDSVIKLIRTDVNFLKDAFDSTHSVHVSITNDMPYKYYLKCVEIFKEKRPVVYTVNDSGFFAYGQSRYQMMEDSLMTIRVEEMNRLYK